MKRWQRWTVLGVLFVATVAALNPAGAFVLTTGRPSDNVSAAGTRAPGQMVRAGIGRHAARLDDFQSVNEITQTSEVPGLVDLFLPDWIDIIFGQINSALNQLIDALFLRAGQTPPSLNQLSSTTVPASKINVASRRSLVDRSLDRLGDSDR